MRCTRCHTELHATHQEHHRASTQTWYECPLCQRRSLYSTPQPRPAPWLLPRLRARPASRPQGRAGAAGRRA